MFNLDVSALKYLLSLSAVVGMLVLAIVLVNSSLVAQVADITGETISDYSGGRFHNAAAPQEVSLGQTLKIFMRFAVEEKLDSVPSSDIPVLPLSREQLLALSDDELHIVKLGHSSILLKLSGEFWLIDPMFSERASPFSFLGPKRFHQPPIALEELPQIDHVLISHNHYDHLDKATIVHLASQAKRFYVPLGVAGDLVKWGVESTRIQSFDWWQELQLKHAKIAFTPTQHFSGRALGDNNATLWGSWVIQSSQGSLFFSGDSGYSTDFKAIGDRYGPFDATFVEVGAYDTGWADIHMLPEQGLQAHLDLRGDVLLPIHNGSFDLAFHAWYELLDRIEQAALAQGVNLGTPRFGEVFQVGDVAIARRWWKLLK